jgi:hypothetical protein
MPLVFIASSPNSNGCKGELGLLDKDGNIGQRKEI